MTATPLPDPGPFRVLPSKAAHQKLGRGETACGQCLGGTCCQSEDAIYLTAFDVLRLAAFFDLSPGEFLRLFTQERFAEGPLEPYRRQGIDDPDSSVVTYLRRRANRSYSPCIFLKYVHDADGTPRRVCSVYAARPLACREYYQHHCKTRGTGEQAALQAHAFEMVRDGKITLEMADTQRARLRPGLGPNAPMGLWLEYAVWTEARRALRSSDANEEGAASYRMADYQDPLDAKIDRLLSKRRLRLEERYGWEPHGDQLQPFRGGVSFVRSPDRERLLRLVATPPSHGLFDDGDYPFFAANRLTVREMHFPRRFPGVGEARKDRLSDAPPAAALFPRHPDPRIRSLTTEEVWRATVGAADAVVTFGSYIATLRDVLEAEPPGTLEWELLCLLQPLHMTKHDITEIHPGLQPLIAWARSVVRRRFGKQRLHRTRVVRPRPAAIRRLIDSQAADGSWAMNPSASALPHSQADYLRMWLHATASGLVDLVSALRTPAQRRM